MNRCTALHLMVILWFLTATFILYSWPRFGGKACAGANETEEWLERVDWRATELEKWNQQILEQDRENRERLLKAAKQAQEKL